MGKISLHAPFNGVKDGLTLCTLLLDEEKLKEVMGRDPEKGYYYFHEWEAQRRVDKKASDLTNNNENAWIQP